MRTDGNDDASTSCSDGVSVNCQGFETFDDFGDGLRRRGLSQLVVRSPASGWEVRMVDDGLGQFDMTGRWVGFYRHRSEHLGAFPITAEVHQKGDRITGEMYDQITDRSELLDTIVEAHRGYMSPGRRLQLERVIRRFGDGKVLVRLAPAGDLRHRGDGRRRPGKIHEDLPRGGGGELEGGRQGTRLGDEEGA